MRRVLLLLLLSLGCSQSLPAQEPTAEAAPPAPSPDALVESGKARHAELGATPEGALKVWFEAVLLATDNDAGRRGAGLDLLGYLTIPFKTDVQWASRPSNAIFVERLETHPYIFRSYAVGSTPDNQYTLNPASWELAVEKKEEGDPRGIKLFVRSGGADSARPIYLKKSTESGLYYVNEFNNVYVGIRKPVDPTVETFE